MRVDKKMFSFERHVKISSHLKHFSFLYHNFQNKNIFKNIFKVLSDADFLYPEVLYVKVEAILLPENVCQEKN